jgi:xanthosine utilization system XapX-like protein
MRPLLLLIVASLLVVLILAVFYWSDMSIVKRCVISMLCVFGIFVGERELRVQ